MYQWIYDRIVSGALDGGDQEVLRIARTLTPSFRAMVRMGKVADKTMRGGVARVGKSMSSPISMIRFYLMFRPRASWSRVGDAIAYSLQQDGITVVQVGILRWTDVSWRPMIEVYTPEGVAEWMDVIGDAKQLQIDMVTA